MSELYQPEQGTADLFIINKRGVGLAILLQFSILFCDLVTIFAMLKGFHFNFPFHLMMLGLVLSMVIVALPIALVFNRL